MQALCKKGFILFFLFLLLTLLSNSVFAVKPTQIATGDSTLELRIPQAEYIELNQADVKLHTHVFNKSNGLAITNETASCYVHIYNETGSHILKETMDFDEDTPFDFTLNISPSNFSQLGLLSYIIQCNTSDQGGFASGSVIVTDDGTEDIQTPYKVLVIFLIILFFMYFLLVLGIWKDEIVAVSIAGMGFIVLGVYLHMNGLGDIKNWISDMFALVHILLGAYLLIKSWGEEAMNQLSG